MKSTKSLTAIFLSILLMETSSCMMKQEIDIDKTGEGRVSVDISLAEYLTDVIDQVQTILRPEKPMPSADEPFFDTKAIRADFETRDGVELLSLESPSRGELRGEFRFENVARILQGARMHSAANRMIRFEEHGEISEFSVMINRATVDSLFEENPSFNNPLVELFGPSATEGMSETDYLDMMGYALGEESRRGITDSALELTVRVEGRILRQTGGNLIDERTVRYSIPLLPLLILDEQLEYSLKYE